MITHDVDESDSISPTRFFLMTNVPGAVLAEIVGKSTAEGSRDASICNRHPLLLRAWRIISSTSLVSRSKNLYR